MKWERFGEYDKAWRRDFYRIHAIRRCVTRYGKSKAWALQKLQERTPTRSPNAMIDMWEEFNSK